MVNIRLLHSFLLVLTLMLTVRESGYSTENNKEKQLVLIIEKTESELGRPIRADLYGINLKTKISDINLSELKKYFGITIDYIINNTIDERWKNQNIQLLKFKIYPKNIGEIVIPQIMAENVSSDKKTIYIRKGKTSEPKISLGTKNPYEQQQFIAHVKILSPDPTSRLSINKKSLIDNFESKPLEFKRTKNKYGEYELIIGWALTPLKSGKFKLKLPEIDYSVSGVLRKKFYLASIPISIKALPSYLPPTTTIGNVFIESSAPQKYWLRSNSINYWNIKLTGNLNDTYKLPPILRQIKNSSKISFFPASSTRTLKIEGNDLISEVNYSIPFKALNSGFLNFPNIQLQFFEPKSGKIITLTHKEKNIFILSLFWEILLAIFILFITLYTTKFYYIKWKKLKHSKIKREYAVQLLKNNNIRSLREAIKLLIESEFWPRNITINQWAGYWVEKYKVSDTFDDFIDALSSSFYSASDNHNINELSLQLQKLIINKKRI